MQGKGETELQKSCVYAGTPGGRFAICEVIDEGFRRIVLNQ
jgi:hypothetical protein